MLPLSHLTPQLFLILLLFLSGAAHYFYNLKAFLERSSLGPHIRVVERRDWRATQRFDVIVLGGKENNRDQQNKDQTILVYSKLQEDLGWPRGTAKKQMIVDRIHMACKDRLVAEGDTTKEEVAPAKP